MTRSEEQIMTVAFLVTTGASPVSTRWSVVKINTLIYQMDFPLSLHYFLGL